ncbi:MAG: potassium transporter Trk [Thiobacillus sp. 63-78]|uniref:TrkH family potassium uptake protein n=1 Tax=Thiobacillus sp. 63-78 TaxID=1895859 RepID=UPI00086A5F05|nr:potassium transporter TrkG [Thiobacillus sp. 63-78]MBN8763417.1 TrkH family potassium uptake protein [Thiobacillus sp.]ODV12713.1 MAG: potassium transporter Trk [Thiobacillus sp. SCN 64-317]MBN8765868.1 TrkH family potassium uptake protein [Thiobacillus sp.]MBN8773869.1 TrkH family potassium uptake protein [Thiobacillus sp.]OJZ15531.1 MAG: potassium transporter Trk [Thiobacillus sp. 63-78]
MSRIAPVLNVLSKVVMLFSATFLLPLTLSWLVADGAQRAYDEAIVVTFAAGALTWLFTRKSQRELQTRDGFLLVVLAWTSLPAFATLPFLIYLPELSFTDAYFETVSGITTTGSTVLTGLDALPLSINLWRGLLVWLGGMGLIVLAVAILPLLGVGGMQIYKAETPGPMKDTKLTPRITETAKGLYLVYVGISIACGLSFWLAGMAPFDAVMHAFSTMGLGGFSSHDASFGHWDSPAIEAVTVVFMLVAGINFSTHFLAWRQRSMTVYRLDPEARWFLIVTLGSSLLIAVFLNVTHVYPDFLQALRYAVFNTVSIATTTGFANTDYNQWPIFAPLWMLLLSGFASCSGSTGGGMKMIRAQLLFRQGRRELARLIHPSARLPVKLAGHVVPNNVIYAVLAFAFMYVLAIIVMTLLMTASGLDLVTAFSAVIASINNAGPGLNKVGPATTYASLTDFQTWICTLAMLLGRLELLTVLVVFTRTFWRA